MRRPNLLLIALSLTLGTATIAAAERHKPAEYQDITDEERAAAKERSRSHMGSWKEVDLPPEYHFPWMQIGFICAALAIAVPFAWSAYNRSAKELRDTDAFAQNGPPKKRAKPAAPVAEEE